MLIGISDDGMIMASDTAPLIGLCDKYCVLEDHTFGIVKKDSFELFDIIGMEKEKSIFKLNCSKDDISKGDFSHYMLKEIYDQPGVIRNLILNYFDDEEINIDSKLINLIRKSNKINFVACGTSMYASYGKVFL